MLATRVVATSNLVMVARFSVSEVLSIYYNNDFSLTEDESCCNKGEEVHAYWGPWVMPTVEVWLLWAELSLLSLQLAVVAPL